jgi:hypothetical protein
LAHIEQIERDLVEGKEEEELPLYEDEELPLYDNI